MTRSPGFGSTACDYAPLSDSVSLRLPYTVKLATNSKSLTHYTKGTPSPHEGASTACRHTVSGTISLPSQGFFSPFPHGTGSLSVGSVYLALRDAPRGFSQGFTCPAILRCRLRVHFFSPTWLSHSMAPLSRGLRLRNGLITLLLPVLQPRYHPKVMPVWAISDFARHYFRNLG